MVHILNKSASDLGHNQHSVVKYHNTDDAKVWHRPMVVEGIPNIYHADAVCNNINITCGECTSSASVNMNYVSDRMVANNRSMNRTTCHRAHCVEQKEDGTFAICSNHHSRVVCPYQFNQPNHSRKFKTPCPYYHFDDSVQANRELEIFTKALIAICPGFFFNINIKSLCFLFGCYMEKNNCFKDEGPARNRNVDILTDILIRATPVENYREDLDVLVRFTKKRRAYTQ